MPDFYGKLIANGWMCCVDAPIRADRMIVREFYAYAAEIDFYGDLVATIRGRQVCFDSTTISNYYVLPDADNGVHTTKAREMGQEGFVTHLHGGCRPKWIENNHMINFSEFIAEANTCLSIICSRMIPSRKGTDVFLDRALLICAFVEGIPINVGQIIVQHI
ncbi:hypothetical protein R3W88_001018 [Solanum pinnatisectum]|uniref:Putative plant transposon protein domain-containing protein n=1 Tax=Solanum pinnatisectum TaxID=50273 RepID=A0AAV9MGY1_9SOLN|nr:hypothetical protein R3W88_001018 [Solanum pinnatisectum]